MKLWEIVRFEAGYQARRVWTWVALLLLFGIMVFLVGLVSEQIATLRFEGRR